MRKVLKIIGILYLCYLSLVILVVLPALNTLPHWYVKETFDRRLHTDLVLFNPFTLSLEIRQAALPEKDGSPFAALRKARANLSLHSLWQPGWVFDELRVEDLYLHLRQTEPGRFNFTDMLEAIPPSPPAPPEEQGLPGLTVHQLDFGAERIVLTDEARDVPFSTHYEGLDISVTELSTVVEEGKPYVISAVAESGGRLHWTGTVSIPQTRSEGRITLDGLSLAPAWRFAEPWLNLELRQGHLNLSGNYRIDWGDALSYAVDGGSLTIRGVDIAARKPEQLPDTGLSLEALSIEGIEVDSVRQHASVASVDISAPAIAGWMDDQTISLQQLFAVSLPEEPAAEADATDAPATPWTASLQRLTLAEGTVEWRSAFTEPELLVVNPLQAHLENLNWPLQGDSPMGVSFTVNSEAALEIDGTLALDPGNGTLQYRLERLPLAWFNPNLPAALKGRITDGSAEMNGEITLAAFAPAIIAMSGAIEDFSGQLEGEEDSLTSWKAVRLTDLLVNLDQRDIRLARVLIDDYEGRVHIAEDGSINAQNVWQEELGEQAEDLAEELELDEPWDFELPEIYISDSAIDFKDESLPISFRTVIGNLRGEILGISSDPQAEAKVDVKGSVDGYAPVVLAGTAAPLAKPPALDLTLTFNGVDLSLLTPYSGTYAGYAIERGLLNLELQYSLEKQRLDGNNEVEIRQLKLGEKIESEKALDVPLELALALLTDANGVIDIAVPVSGDVDDPEFGLGSAIGTAFVNLITKAVTAPFALLANLVGTEQDLQRLNFSSGSAELGDTNRVKLDQLTQALEQRPALTLIVMGRLNPETDREYLQIAGLRQELLAAGLSQQALENKDKPYLDEIERRYRDLGIAGELPGPPQQYDAVRETIPVSDDALLALIQDRAVAIKTYLVSERGMEADRIAIEQTPLDDESHQFSGVELGLE